MLTARQEAEAELSAEQVAALTDRAVAERYEALMAEAHTMVGKGPFWDFNSVGPYLNARRMVNRAAEDVARDRRMVAAAQREAA